MGGGRGRARAQYERWRDKRRTPNHDISTEKTRFSAGINENPTGHLNQRFRRPGSPGVNVTMQDSPRSIDNVVGSYLPPLLAGSCQRGAHQLRPPPKVVRPADDMRSDHLECTQAAAWGEAAAWGTWLPWHTPEISLAERHGWIPLI